MGFFDRPTRRGVPRNVISTLIPSIVAFANESAKSVVALVESTGSHTLDTHGGSRIVVDFIFFNYQWVDRVAYNVLRDTRDAFMDSLRSVLIAELVDVLLQPGLSARLRSEAIEGLEQMLDQFLREFGSYNAIPERQGGSLKGTLFWKFGKRVARNAGRSDDALVITHASVCAMNSVRTMDVGKMLAELGRA